MNKEFNMEEAAKKALEQFDREHGTGEVPHNEARIPMQNAEPVYDKDGFALCPCGCGAKTHRDVLEKRIQDKKNELGHAEMSAKIESVPGTDQLGVICQLPETKDQAYMLLLGMINTMCMASDDTFEQVIAEVVKMKSMNVMEKGRQIEVPGGQ